MALDNRIEQLEKEFALLKNEIQSVLLNIQEQVLAQHQSAFAEAEAAAAYGRAQPPQETVVENVPPLRPQISEEGAEDQREMQQEAPSPPPGEPAFSRDGQEEEEAISPSPRESRGPAEVAPVAGIRQPGSPVSRHLDVATVVGLAKWVDESTKGIGCRRTVEIVEIYDMAGHLAPEVKEVLLRFISLNDAEEPRRQVPMRDVMINMLRLDRILGRKADAAAVLALFIGKEE